MAARLKLRETFGVGVNPSHLAVAPDGQHAYVTNSNDYGIPGSDSVTVLDLQRGVPAATIRDASFVAPYRIALSADGKYGYVCNSGSPAAAGQAGTVSVVNLRTNSVAGTIAGFDGPGAIVLGKGRAYVTNYGAPGGAQSGNGKTVSVVDLAAGRVAATVAVDLAPAALALSPCQRYLYVACYVDGNPGTGTLDVVCTETNTVVRRMAGFSGPFAIALTPCGRRAYVTNFGSNNFAPYGTTVSAVDLKRLRIEADVEVGIQPAGLAVVGDYAYVTTFNSLYAGPGYQNLTMGEGTVVAVCTKTNTVAGPALAVGLSPSSLVAAPGGETLYLCKYTGNVVAALAVRGQR